MNFTDIQKNRIDNEIQEVRDRRNVWLATSLSAPVIIFGALFSVNQGGVGVAAGLLAYLIFDSIRDKTQEELESKIKELRKLEENRVGARKRQKRKSKQ